MAQSITTPKTQVPKYIDISLTFRANPVTGDIVTLTDADAIKASVVNLILTMNFESPFHPEVGSAVMHSLFENYGPLTEVNIRRSILDVLQNFEPRVNVINVTVVGDPDHNGYSALITYQIINQTTPVTITVFLEKLR